jgi:hypothetical protein
MKLRNLCFLARLATHNKHIAMIVHIMGVVNVQMILTQRPIIFDSCFLHFQPQQLRTEFQLKATNDLHQRRNWFQLATETRAVTHRRSMCRPRDYYRRCFVFGVW